MQDDTMRAVMYLGPEHLELRDVPIPRPGPGEILVRVRAALTDGTDLKTYRRGHPKITPPILFGHEFSGDVVRVGDGVDAFETGMRVVAHNTAPCGTCYYCKLGQHSMCGSFVVNSGAYAEYIVVPSRIVELSTFELPKHLSYAQAAAMEPLACVVHGQDLIRIQPGESVAIIGAGGSIGLMHLQMARHRGASQIIAVDIHDSKLDLAKELGATSLINASEENVVEIVKELTEGRGADVTIESAGAAEAWGSAYKAVRKGGRVLWFGGLKPGTTLELDTAWVHYGELTLFGVFHATPIDVHRAFQLIAAGIVDTSSLITGELPLERLEDGLKMMIKGEAVKVAIIP